MSDIDEHDTWHKATTPPPKVIGQLLCVPRPTPDEDGVVDDVDEKARRYPDWKPMFVPFDMAEALRDQGLGPLSTAEEIAAALRTLADIVEADDE